MSHRRAIHPASLAIGVPVVVCLALGLGKLARGQQSAPANAPAKSAAPPATSRAADDAARKAEILSSDCWRRAMFDFNSWLRTQKVYPPEEVARIRADFTARVDAMSADELKLVQADLETVVAGSLPGSPAEKSREITLVSKAALERDLH